MDANGITKEEALIMLEHDIATCENENKPKQIMKFIPSNLEQFNSYLATLDESIQAGLKENLQPLISELVSEIAKDETNISEYLNVIESYESETKWNKLDQHNLQTYPPEYKTVELTLIDGFVKMDMLMIQGDGYGFDNTDLDDVFSWRIPLPDQSLEIKEKE